MALISAAALTDEYVLRPVEVDNGLLLSTFNRHKSHPRPSDRLTGRLCIRRVILLTLDIRLHELGRHQPYLVPQVCKLPLLMVSGVASLDIDQRPRKLREKCQ